MADEVVASNEVVQIKFILKDFAEAVEVECFMGIELFFGHFLRESWDLSNCFPIRRKVPFSWSDLFIPWSEPTTSPDIGHRSKINQPASMVAIHHDIDLL